MHLSAKFLPTIFSAIINSKNQIGGRKLTACEVKLLEIFRFSSVSDFKLMIVPMEKNLKCCLSVFAKQIEIRSSASHQVRLRKEGKILRFNLRLEIRATLSTTFSI